MSPLDFLSRPASWLESISRLRGTVAGGPNFGYELCSRRVTDAERAGLDLSSWEVAFSGAEKINAAVLRRFQERFAAQGFRSEAWYGCYGLAEATLLVTGGRVGHGITSLWLDRGALAEGKVSIRPGPGDDAVEVVSCGRPPSGHAVVIADPVAGVALAEDEVGEVWACGPSLASGYRGRRDLTAEVFAVRLPDGDGPFLRTGDLGFRHDGDLYLTGRRKDLIIVAGRNVYPTDVEETVQSVDRRLRPGCGVAVQLTGDDSEPVVMVQETGEEDSGELAGLAADIRRAVAERHDVGLDRVVLVPPRTVPKTSSGKLRRSACRQDYLDGVLDVRHEWRRKSTSEEEA
jgi:acyl-CoA synthetase (AMP-forming)/AMP-acid ligase II